MTELPADTATTAWGAPLDDPRRAAASLRALASRHGADLRPAGLVDTVDLVAAVIGTDLLAHACGTARLDELSRHARPALARLVLRASGTPSDPADPVTANGQLPLALTARLDDLLCWAQQWVPGQLDQVTARAAADLAGDSSRPAAAVASCLGALA